MKDPASPEHPYRMTDYDTLTRQIIAADSQVQEIEATIEWLCRSCSGAARSRQKVFRDHLDELEAARARMSAESIAVLPAQRR